MDVTAGAGVGAALAGAIVAEAIRRQVRAGRFRRATDPPAGHPDQPGPPPLTRWLNNAALPLICALGSAWIVMTWASYPVLAAAYLLFWWGGCLLSAIDLDVHRLPDAIVLPGILAVALFTLLLAGLSHWWPDGVPLGRGSAVEALPRAAIAGLAVPGALLLVSLAAPAGAGLGLGDIKLSAALAPLLAWHGWQPLLVGLWGAFVSAGLVAVVLMVTRRARRGDHLAFGPALVLGTLVGLISAAGLMT